MKKSSCRKQLKIHQLDTSKIKNNGIIVFIAKRGTGKTTGMISVLFHKRREFDCGKIFSMTESMNGTWSEFVSPLYIETEYNPESLKLLIEKQERAQERILFRWMVRYKRKPTKQERTKLKQRPIFVVFEDCVGEGSFAKDKILRKLFMNGRHYNICILICLQYLKYLPPALRMNVDYIFLGKESSSKIRSALFDEFFGFFNTKREFNNVFKNLTNNRGWIVVNTTAPSTDIKDNYFWLIIL